MKKWEYLFIRRADFGDPILELSESLNILGDDGWELVSVLPGQLQRNSFYFKREKPPSVLGPIILDKRPYGAMGDRQEPEKPTEPLSSSYTYKGFVIVGLRHPVDAPVDVYRENKFIVRCDSKDNAEREIDRLDNEQ